MSDLNEIECGELCKHANQCLYEVNSSLSSFPGFIEKIILQKAWERRTVNGRIIELGSLRELIMLKPIEGWGEDPKKIEAVIKDTPEVLVMWREAMNGLPLTLLGLFYQIVSTGFLTGTDGEHYKRMGRMASSLQRHRIIDY